MTIREALLRYKDIEIEILLEYLLKKSREFLYTQPDFKLSTPQIGKLKTYASRRKKGEPIAYILGVKYFFGLKFKVTKDTLIPRPETEWLVEKALKITKSNRKKYKILDMGTGTGCISICIKTFNKNGEMHAADVSLGAIRVAKINAKTHGAKITFYHSNLFSRVPHSYDIIIANLPYVPQRDYRKLYKHLKFEPKNALTDGTNDAVLLKSFISQVATHLKPKARILLEIDPSQELELVDLAKQNSRYKKHHVYKDLKNLSRYIIIEYK